MASKIQVDKISRNSGTPEFTIPTADGTSGQFIKTDASGVLSFGSAPALTGSTNTWIPTITAANALTGTANFTYDGNILDVKNSGTASSIKLYCESSNAHAQEIKAAPHAGSSDWTLTLPPTVPSVSGQVLSATTAGVASWADAGGGKVLQVLTATDSTQRSTTSATFVTASNTLTVDITPSATSSKILIMISTVIGNNTEEAQAISTIFRDSTNLGDATKGMLDTYHYGGTTRQSASLIYLDSPSSTSELTYQLYVTQTVVGGSSVEINYGGATGSIIVMEIGA